MRHRLLLVDDDARARDRTRTFLERRGFDVDCAGWIAQAQRLLSSVCYEAVVTDLQLSAAEGAEGLAVVVVTRRRCPATRIVLLAREASDSVAEAAHRLGVDVVMRERRTLPDLEGVIRALLPS